MLFFSRLTTRTRLCLMLLFPMMGLTYFSITSAISAFNTKEDAAYLGKTMNVSVAAGTLMPGSCPIEEDAACSSLSRTGPGGSSPFT